MDQNQHHPAKFLLAELTRTGKVVWVLFTRSLLMVIVHCTFFADPMVVRYVIYQSNASTYHNIGFGWQNCPGATSGDPGTSRNVQSRSGFCTLARSCNVPLPSAPNQQSTIAQMRLVNVSLDLGIAMNTPLI
jgi:hypothetical protein